MADSEKQPNFVIAVLLTVPAPCYQGALEIAENVMQSSLAFDSPHLKCEVVRDLRKIPNQIRRQLNLRF